MPQFYLGDEKVLDDGLDCVDVSSWCGGERKHPEVQSFRTDQLFDDFAVGILSLRARSKRKINLGKASSLVAGKLSFVILNL